MKNTAISITICTLALLIAYGGTSFAAEVTGTISTGETATTTPTPTPNPSGNPGGDGSEVTGELGTGNNGDNNEDMGGNVVENNPSPSPPPSIYYPYVNPDTYTPPPEEPAEEEATTTSAISDEEMARLALLPFGPRFGVPPPGDVSTLTIGRIDESPSLDGTGGPDEDIPLYALVPRYGEGPLEAEDLTATALSSASGLTIPQLLLIALVGLGVLTSMGYAISRNSGLRKV